MDVNGLFSEEEIPSQYLNSNLNLFCKYLKKSQHKTNLTLRKILPRSQASNDLLYQAMCYSMESNGKRFRSALLFAVGEACHSNPKALLICSAVIEIIHCFSLIHDDLPALDNSDLRRGRPSCHKAFGEGIAILTGDALLTLAFETLTSLTEYGISPIINLRMIRLVSQYIGYKGMAEGEALDLMLTDQAALSKYFQNTSIFKCGNHSITSNQNTSTKHQQNNATQAYQNNFPEHLLHVYTLKTSYLICCSIILGALCSNKLSSVTQTYLEKFGLYLGLCFQIQDDILDITTSTEKLGKPQGSDLANQKPTYAVVKGIETSKKYARLCLQQAFTYLKKSKIESPILEQLGYYCLWRMN